MRFGRAEEIHSVWFDRSCEIPGNSEVFARAKSGAPGGDDYLCLPSGPRDCLIATLIVMVGADHSTVVRIMNPYAKSFVFQAGQRVAELVRVSPVQGEWHMEPQAIHDSQSFSGASGAAEAEAATSGRLAGMTSDWEAVLDIAPTFEASIEGAVAEQADAGRVPPGASTADSAELLLGVNLRHLEEDKRAQVSNLLTRYAQLFNLKEMCGARDIVVPIPLDTDKPIFVRQYPLARAHIDFLKDHIEEMQRLDLAEKSVSSYNLPVLVVRKPSSIPGKPPKYRMVLDGRQLNAHIKDDIVVPLPKISEALEALAFSKYFTCLDLSQGFFNLKIEEAHTKGGVHHSNGGTLSIETAGYGNKKRISAFPSSHQSDISRAHRCLHNVLPG